MDQAAQSYVRLVLALGNHDPGYVDAYYGPQDWRDEVEAAPPSVPQILGQARELGAQLADLDLNGESEMVQLRRSYLVRQLEAVAARASMLQGESWSFDEESRALYDAVSPRFEDQHYASALQRLDQKLRAMGLEEGPLGDRLERLQTRFAVPRERLNAVFDAAIQACRERTARHIELPEGETFEVEYVHDKPWSGYNWYQGGYRSLIQVNVDLPVSIERALDLACHEGYPGHHVYNALLEQRLVRGRGWPEYSVYPLFSPQSPIAEGTANFGIEMAFPGPERIRFERDVLFPLAGLDPAEAEGYQEILALLEDLRFADNDAARAYLDGELDAQATVDWLMRYGGALRPRAEQRLRFIETYRSYVINYTVGQDLVRAWIEREAGEDHAARWRLFADLLSSPRLPSGLL